jgi:hypothetical protein
MASDTQSNSSKQDLFVTLQGIIVAAHVSMCRSPGQALGFGLQAGNALLEIKQRKLIRHGQRGGFHRRTCGSERTAQSYMQLARNRAAIEAANTQSIREAFRLIRQVAQ